MNSLFSSDSLSSFKNLHIPVEVVLAVNLH